MARWPANAAAATGLAASGNVPPATMFGQMGATRQAAMGGTSQPRSLLDYSCQYCHKTFEDKYKRKRHEMIHTGEMPFACPFCPYRSNQKGNVKTHMANKHHER